MSLGPARCQFTLHLAELIVWAHGQGIDLAIDGTKVGPGDTIHLRTGAHPGGLAADLIYYLQPGVPATKSEDHLAIGERWELLGGIWGGRFRDSKGDPRPDGNHYEWPRP